MGIINQIIELKKPIFVVYEGRILSQTINVTKIYVLRNGKPGHLIDEKGVKYDFEYIEDKELIYHAIIKNLMFKELI